MKICNGCANGDSTRCTNTGSKEDPQSLNRYIYARDNPLSYNDPTGHMLSYILGTDNVVGTGNSTPYVTPPTYGNMKFIAGTDYVTGAGEPSTTVTTTTTSSSTSTTTATTTTTTSSSSSTTSSTSSSSSTSQSQFVGPPAPLVGPPAPSTTSTNSGSTEDRCQQYGFTCGQAGSWAFVGAQILGTGIIFGVTRGLVMITPAGPGMLMGDLSASEYVLAYGPEATPSETVAEYSAGFAEGTVLWSDVSGDLWGFLAGLI